MTRTQSRPGWGWAQEMGGRSEGTRGLRPAGGCQGQDPRPCFSAGGGGGGGGCQFVRPPGACLPQAPGPPCPRHPPSVTMTTRVPGLRESLTTCCVVEGPQPASPMPPGQPRSPWPLTDAVSLSHSASLPRPGSALGSGLCYLTHGCTPRARRGA